MTCIGLIVRPGIDRATLLAREFMAWATKRAVTVLADLETAHLLELDESGVPQEEVARRADLIVTLGGDGTLLGVARHVDGKSPLLLGVNFGNLGFLTEISPQEFFPVLEDSVAGKAKVSRRPLFNATVERAGKVIFSSQGINETVVQKGSRERLLDLDLWVADEAVMRLRADGVIISTPTGSSAYSLAAGGTIAHPSLEIFLITPICPHSLTNRPFLVPSTYEVQVVVPEYDGEVFVVVDGQISAALKSGDRVKVIRSKAAVTYVQSPTRSYFEILRTKLNWGIPNKSE